MWHWSFCFMCCNDQVKDDIKLLCLAFPFIIAMCGYFAGKRYRTVIELKLSVQNSNPTTVQSLYHQLKVLKGKPI